MPAFVSTSSCAGETGEIDLYVKVSTPPAIRCQLTILPTFIGILIH